VTDQFRLKPVLFLLFHADLLHRHINPPAGQDQVRHAHIAHEADEPVLKRLRRPMQRQAVADRLIAGSQPIKQIAEFQQRQGREIRGDLISAGRTPDTPQDPALMQDLEDVHQQGQGKLAVLGNHEFYHGMEASLECFRRLGARVIRNEIVELPGGLQVAGVDDIRTVHLAREEVSSLLSKLDPNKPSIFLSHQPLMFDAAAQHGVGLMLSGHTHRGQIFPFGLFVKIFYRYLYGLYRQGDSVLYVTSGAGQWGPPMRLFAPPEIVRIVLRSPR